jgi:ribosome-associated translation inhibitor RaiA
MQVIFESRNPDAASLRGMAVARLQFVMRRLSWLVPRARLQLSDVNGPRGGVDKRCQVELKSDAGTIVVISSVSRDWRSAIDSALSRASRALLRQWQRSQGKGQAASAAAHRPAGLGRPGRARPTPRQQAGADGGTPPLAGPG